LADSVSARKDHILVSPVSPIDPHSASRMSLHVPQLRRGASAPVSKYHRITEQIDLASFDYLQLSHSIAVHGISGFYQFHRLDLAAFAYYLLSDSSGSQIYTFSDH